MLNHRFNRVFIVSIVLLFAYSCSLMCKNPVLKGTRWTAVQKMFVADAGTMTINHTLEFTSGKDVLVGWSTYLPAHPATYVNPDGTVDTLPAQSSENTEPGTYVYKRGKLTITSKEGYTTEYVFQEDGTFLCEEPRGEKIVFSRSGE